MAGGRLIYPFAMIYSKNPPREFQTFFPSMIGFGMVFYYWKKSEYLVDAEEHSQFWNRSALFGKHNGRANHKWKHSKYEIQASQAEQTLKY